MVSVQRCTESCARGCLQVAKSPMNFALYIISAAISMRRIRYMVSKNLRSSDFVVVTVVSGASMW